MDKDKMTEEEAKDIANILARKAYDIVLTRVDGMCVSDAGFVVAQFSATLNINLFSAIYRAIDGQVNEKTVSKQLKNSFKTVFKKAIDVLKEEGLIA